MRVLDLLSFALATFMVGAYFGRMVRPSRPIAVNTLRGVTLLIASGGLRAAARLTEAGPDALRAVFWMGLALQALAVWLIWRGQTATPSSVRMAP